MAPPETNANCELLKPFSSLTYATVGITPKKNDQKPSATGCLSALFLMNKVESVLYSWYYYFLAHLFKKN